MLTIDFAPHSSKPKYERLYLHIKDAIVAGRITRGEKLPSKRKLAAHLAIALNTVENAYAQLLAEGFIESVEKKGYFAVSHIPDAPTQRRAWLGMPAAAESAHNVGRFNLRTNAVDTTSFPFATWSRLMRDSLREDHARLVQEMHPQGDRQLREEIAGYLLNYRNMTVSPEQIVIGAGTTYLLGMMTELLPESKFAIEEPGYFMLARTLKSRGVPFACVHVDSEGMDMKKLRTSGSSVCMATPSNQFPLCQVMSIGRRMAMLEWAHESPGRFIIEDDYDSDYRYSLKPAPALHSLDNGERVIYFNTFARTLTPSLRIAYMVLPYRLMEVYWTRRSLYSCTVSGFEQRTLLRFIHGGHYERHLNRMRTIYKRRRNALVQALEGLGGDFRVRGTEAGLHLLISSAAGMREGEMITRAAEKDVTVYGLSSFFHKATGESDTIVAGFGGLPEEELREAGVRLCQAWKPVKKRPGKRFPGRAG